MGFLECLSEEDEEKAEKLAELINKLESKGMIKLIREEDKGDKEKDDKKGDTS